MRDVKFDGLRPYVEALWGWNQREQEEHFDAAFAAERCCIVLVDGVDAGWIEVIEQPAEVYLAGIYLLDAVRRRGVGTAIVRDLSSFAAESGRPLTLQVLKNNPARRLYERLGFEVTGTRGEHILLRLLPTPRS